MLQRWMEGYVLFGGMRWWRADWGFWCCDLLAQLPPVALLRMNSLL
jgi:hypothetical protein